MMHDDQIDLGTDAARDLIRAQFPQFRGQQVERLDGPGTVNAVFRIGSQAAARFPLRAGDPIEAATTLRREAAAMSELARHCPFPSPLPVGLGRPGAGYPMPWAVQTWIPGEVATPDGLAGSHTLARDLVTLVASLRAAGTAGRRFDGQGRDGQGSDGPGRGGNLRDHDAWLAVCLANSEGLLDVARLRGAWARLRDLPPCGPEVMSHRDLIPANLLVRDGHLVGVLDGGSFGPADPALDLVAAWHLLDRKARETVRSGLGSGDVEWRRGAAWALQQAMGLVWYYRETNPAMSALGRSTLRRILEDPGI